MTMRDEFKAIYSFYRDFGRWPYHMHFAQTGRQRKLMEAAELAYVGRFQVTEMPLSMRAVIAGSQMRNDPHYKARRREIVLLTRPRLP